MYKTTDGTDHDTHDHYEHNRDKQDYNNRINQYIYDVAVQIYP